MTEADMKAARRVDANCPSDETTLRVSDIEGKLICPVCWTYYDPPKELKA